MTGLSLQETFKTKKSQSIPQRERHLLLEISLDKFSKRPEVVVPAFPQGPRILLFQIFSSITIIGILGLENGIKDTSKQVIELASLKSRHFKSDKFKVEKNLPWLGIVYQFGFEPSNLRRPLSQLDHNNPTITTYTSLCLPK